MPVISIVIPVYNHAKELAACLASLERQTFRDFDVTIVDDGSAAPLQATAYKLQAHWIRFETNRGAPAARNEGFKHATGTYVMFLDADAVLEPDALEVLKGALDAHPEAAFAYPSFHFGWKLFRSRPFDAEALKRGNYIHTSALIRREAFPGFDEALTKFQDWDLFLTMAERGAKGLWVDRVLYTFKTRRDGMSRWMPSFVHRLPWPMMGWMPREVRRYREAEAVIKKKHHL